MIYNWENVLFQKSAANWLAFACLIIYWVAPRFIKVGVPGPSASHMCAMSRHHNLKTEEMEEKPKLLHLHVEAFNLRSFIVKLPVAASTSSWSEVTGLCARPHLTRPNMVAHIYYIKSGNAGWVDSTRIVIKFRIVGVSTAATTAATGLNPRTLRAYRLFTK